MNTLVIVMENTPFLVSETSAEIAFRPKPGRSIICASGDVANGVHRSRTYNEQTQRRNFSTDTKNDTARALIIILLDHVDFTATVVAIFSTFRLLLKLDYVGYAVELCQPPSACANIYPHLPAIAKH